MLGACVLLKAPAPLRKTDFKAPIDALLPLPFALCFVIMARIFDSVSLLMLIDLLGFFAEPGGIFL